MMNTSLAPPSVADLLDKSRSVVTVDGLWLSRECLALMLRDLRERSAIAVKSDPVGYDKAVLAHDAAVYALRLLNRQHERQRDTGDAP
jgi:hypothetical protein